MIAPPVPAHLALLPLPNAQPKAETDDAAYKAAIVKYNISDYVKKYKTKLESLKDGWDNVEINNILMQIRNENLQELNDEMEMVMGLIGKIVPFANNIESWREKLAQMLNTDENWIIINSRHKNANAAQIKELLNKFESVYFDKAYEAVYELECANRGEQDESNSQNPDIEYENIYPDEVGENETETVNTDDTTPLTESDLRIHVYEHMENSEKYSFIKLFCYDLWINDINERKEKINSGENDVEYMKCAKKRYFNQKYKKLENSIIMEYTPLGNVIMYYNVNNESFEYYSDKSIPFAVLETVARRYVIVYGCKELYVETETVELLPQDTEAEKRKRMFKPNTSQMLAGAQTARAPIRGWGQSSSLAPIESVPKKYKSRTNNFIRKECIIAFKALQVGDKKIVKKHASWQEYKRQQMLAAQLTHPIATTSSHLGMDIPTDIQTHITSKSHSSADDTTSSTF
jgi:ribosomal protein S24E